DLIYASGTGYGTDSPFRDQPGQDLIIQALSGLAAATGRAGEDPVPVGAAVVDQHGAALLAMGILAALLHRERTGEGQRLELPMLAAAIDLATEPLVYRANGAGNERPREPVASTFHGAPYGIYRTRDRHIALSMSPLAQVSAALGDPPSLRPYLDPARAYRDRDRIRAAVAPLLRNRPTEELLDDLRRGGVWCAVVNDLGQALEDPAVRFLEPFWEIDHPRAGRVRVVAHPVRYGAGRPELRHLPPEVGEHTAEVLAELGYGAGELGALVAETEPDGA
ncbi:MAG: CaiB/BaiF CoA transferase family protein, partial [Candidatus Dormibacteraceae bacterium]